MYACEKRENAQFSRVAKTFKRSEEEKRRKGGYDSYFFYELYFKFYQSKRSWIKFVVLLTDSTFIPTLQYNHFFTICYQ